MSLATRTKHHDNNFGVLRLLLAYAVIISHAPQMIDGTFKREPLVALGANITLGTLAVDGFFIISGYLIASSYLSSNSLSAFLKSRIARIYPGFIAASLICIFIVAPLSGAALARLSGHDWIVSLAKLLFLVQPDVPGAFHGIPIPALNGSMWTIRNEFRCYLLVALLGASGLLRNRRAILGLTVLLFAAAIAIFYLRPVIAPGWTHKFVFAVIGDPSVAFILSAVFMGGVCFRAFREQIKFNGVMAAMLAIVWLIALLTSPLIEAITGVIGPYLILWLALAFKSTILQNINNRYDFSYGTYLYAWPIASLIVLACQHRFFLSPFVLDLFTVILATAAGALSWYLIEKPALALLRRRPSPPAGAASKMPSVP
jgi:peptidoglycan/LPS O-acetylase OafA/YrhL